MERVAVVKWGDHDGIAKTIGDELVALGHTPVFFRFDWVVPKGVDVVFSFAPYGRFLHIPRQVANVSATERPVFVHWNTENPPDPRIPWFLTNKIAGFRSWSDRLSDSEREWVYSLANIPPLSLLNRRLNRFRYIGDYYYAYRRGWINVFVESSQVYAEFHSKHGLPTTFVPWGTGRDWYADLKLERDIDVIWFGQRRTKRRSHLIDGIREQLAMHGFKMYIADNVENPFIYDHIRTQFLNRAKVTLNLLTQWYESVLPYRFHVAAGNRSLVVSEPELPHCPMIEPRKHYVAVPSQALIDAIIYYLEHEKERREIAENAYRLVTTELTFGNSVKKIMDAVDAKRR